MRIPVISIGVLFILTFLIDFYISQDIKGMFGRKWRIAYWISAACCWILLIVALCLPRRDADSSISAVMWMLYTYLSIYAGKLFYLISSAIGRLCRVISRIKCKWYPSRIIGVVLGLSVIGIMWWGAGYTRRHLKITERTIYSTKLPEGFEGYRIVQLSDLHVGTWGKDTSFLRHLIDTVNSLQPDLIVFTGDIVNRQSKELEPFVDVLKELKAKDGVFSIMGNHDYGDYVDWKRSCDREDNRELLNTLQSNMGWHLLNNEMAVISDGIDSVMLIGVENWGEPPFPQYGDLKKAMGEQTKNDRSFKILLSHNPEHWNKEVSKDTNIDITLSGHTHAMQMLLKIGDWEWSPAKYRYEQWGGHYIRNNENGEPTQLYVNIGSGAVGMPSRLMSAYPEITLLTLRNGEVK